MLPCAVPQLTACPPRLDGSPSRTASDRLNLRESGPRCVGWERTAQLGVRSVSSTFTQTVSVSFNNAEVLLPSRPSRQTPSNVPIANPNEPRPWLPQSERVAHTCSGDNIVQCWRVETSHRNAAGCPPSRQRDASLASSREEDPTGGPPRKCRRTLLAAAPRP